MISKLRTLICRHYWQAVNVGYKTKHDRSSVAIEWWCLRCGKAKGKK